MIRKRKVMDKVGWFMGAAFLFQPYRQLDLTILGKKHMEIGEHSVAQGDDIQVFKFEERRCCNLPGWEINYHNKAGRKISVESLLN